jgi:hypothetical protein
MNLADTVPQAATAKLHFVRCLKETIARSHQAFVVSIHVTFEISIEQLPPAVAIISIAGITRQINLICPPHRTSSPGVPTALNGGSWRDCLSGCRWRCVIGGLALLPWIDHVDPGLLEVFGVARGQGRAMGPADGGYLAVEAVDGEAEAVALSMSRNSCATTRVSSIVKAGSSRA